jgi:hypothetical protein
MSLKECTVSMVGKDGRTYETTVEATGLFDAADRAIQQWSRLWWYRPNGVSLNPSVAGPSTAQLQRQPWNLSQRLYSLPVLNDTRSDEIVEESQRAWKLL